MVNDQLSAWLPTHIHSLKPSQVAGTAVVAWIRSPYLWLRDDVNAADCASQKAIATPATRASAHRIPHLQANYPASITGLQFMNSGFCGRSLGFSGIPATT